MTGPALGAPPPPHRDPATLAAGRSGAPASLVLWRSLIAVLAWWGLVDALGGDLAGMKFFSQITCCAVALTATAGALTAGVRSERWQRALSWARGATTTYAVVTAIIYATLLAADYSRISSLLEHAVVPALVLIDWLWFGPGRRQAWWTPLSWLAVPVAYLGVYFNVRNSRGAPLYPFLDPEKASFWRWVAIMLAVFVIVGFVMWALGLARMRLRAGRRGPAAS